MRRAAVWWVAAAIFFVQALRLRNHASGLRLLKAGKPAAEADEQPIRAWHWLLADGVDVPVLVRRPLETYAESEGLDVMEVVPRDLPPEQAVRLLAWASPVGYRSRRFAEPITALQAILVEDATLKRSGLRDVALGGHHDPIVMQRLATELVRAAPTSKDVVVADGVGAVAEDPLRRRAYLRTLFGPMLEPLSGLALLAPVVRLGFLATGLVFSPIAGAVAMVTWCLQPMIAFAGTPLRPGGLWWRSAFRWLIAPVTLVRVFAGQGRPDPEFDTREELEALRPVYTELLAGGTERFFEQRRFDCPMCGCSSLRTAVRIPDLMQRKPGRFVLERCSNCRHVFQNPRLSPEGLDFYYRDFYEGLGEEILDALFAGQGYSYRGRVAMLDGLAQPSRWLDVGAGHGHFCLAASEYWPETHFDGLDMSTSIDEAVNRGWVETGYRGQLLDLSADLKSLYDVVSMHHYLEHTRDPLRELDAARTLLHPGGYLLIEVPDPDCGWGPILRQYWMSWLQPQHQNLMPFDNLRSALVDRGFEIVRWDRGAAGQALNIAGALLFLLIRLAPAPGLPWRPKDNWVGRVRFQIAWAMGAPILSLALALDFGMLRWYKHRGRSNAYRILARVTENA